MHTYNYLISFKVTHPSRSLNDVFDKLSKLKEFSNGRLHNINDDRVSPRGKPLEGKYPESWCSFNLLESKQSSSVEELEYFLSNVLIKIEKHKAIFDELVHEGVGLAFFIGLFIDANSGLVLDATLLKRLADLEIELQFDIYPPDRVTQ